MKMMENIDKCAKNIGQTTIETRAYLRALSESKGLNIAKHVQQVEKEIAEGNKSQEGNFPILSVHYIYEWFHDLFPLHLLWTKSD